MNLSKEEIIQRLRSCSNEFTTFCAKIPGEVFFHQPPVKWSIAQNVKHLVISGTTTKLAFILPKFIVRLYAGKPNRRSRSYDELVNKYKLKLQQGGKASGIYIPKTIDPQTGNENMLNDFLRTMNRLISSIHKNYRDDQLDQFLAPHPLLGKITLRELCYFTIYHTQHHLNIIKERCAE